MSDDQKLLLSMNENLIENKVYLENLSEKLANHIELTAQELKAINALDNEQNRLLDAHIAGVNTLRDMHIQHREEAKEQLAVLKEMMENQKKDMENRLEALEKPYDLVKYAGKVIMWVGGIAGAILAIMKFLGAI